jgi:6,7-dimethyl-8-ribityllumazine synthase
MASSIRNLSSTSPNQKDFSLYKIGIAVSSYHSSITGSLLDACKNRLLEAGIKPEHIYVSYAPGAFELPLACQRHLFNSDDRLCNAAIALGCIIQGETRHFEFIAQAVAQGCMKLSLKYNKPVAFGVLTTDTLEQAQDRSGGKYGNKGIEAAEAVLQML